MFARFVPNLALIIPLYVVMRNSGMLNSLTGVILAKTAFLLPTVVLVLLLQKYVVRGLVAGAVKG